jgi:hypothetical protein
VPGVGVPPPVAAGGPARPEPAEKIKRNRLLVSMHIDLVEFFDTQAPPGKTEAVRAK